MTGKVERFQRSLWAEFLTGRVFESLEHAQTELDTWVAEYNDNRPHQSLGMKTPLEVFTSSRAGVVPVKTGPQPVFQDRVGHQWITRKVNAAVVVTVSWQQFSLGKHRGGRKVDIHVSQGRIQIWDGADLLKTVPQDNPDRRCE